MADLNQLKPVGKLNPFTKFCCTIGNLPTSYMISLTYEEQLLWLCNYLEKTVIPTVNNNAEAVQELQELYIQLKDYVDNYFENLDVQEEINNKLDEMVESGQLQELITHYLQLKGLLCFDTLSDLKNAENIINGSFVKTYGTNTMNDGIMFFYKIREIENTDVVDNLNLISLTNYPNLIAERISNFITNDKTNPIYYGADPTGQVDSSSAINNCILANKGGTINFSQGSYIVNQTINLPYLENEKVSINGNGAKLINNVTLDRLFYVGFDKGTNESNNVGFPSYIKDLFVDGENSNTTYCIDIIKGYKDLKIFNCKFYRFLNGMRIGETTGTPADVLMNDCLLYGKGSELDGTGIIMNSSDNNINTCRIYGFRKGFIVNGGSLIKECHVLLRWTNQTNSNFDPYPRNGSLFNLYYPLTMFAEVNTALRLIDCFGDSVYKMLEINTSQAINVIGLNYFNSRGDVDNRLFDFLTSTPKFLLINSTLNLGKNIECEVIHLRQRLNNYAQFKVENALITNIARLTNPADIIMCTQAPYIANKSLTTDNWYVVSIISNNSPYNIINGKLYINGFEYTLRFNCDQNINVNLIYQFNTETDKSIWTLGTLTIDDSTYICVKPSNNIQNVKFNYITNYSSNIVFDVVPVKNDSVNTSSRLLSDYTSLTPSYTLPLSNVLGSI